MSDRIEIELDDQGRLVLPIPLAQRLGLARGTTLIVEQETSEATYIRVQTAAPVIDKGGVFVITGVTDQPLHSALREEREQHLEDIWERNHARLT
jgi:bifunctional DNA-binding transcriptional regulator/antitoxin component of YhaV-PrlF toxin-antitoxin module